MLGTMGERRAGPCGCATGLALLGFDRDRYPATGTRREDWFSLLKHSPVALLPTMRDPSTPDFKPMGLPIAGRTFFCDTLRKVGSCQLGDRAVGVAQLGSGQVSPA